MNLFSPAMPKGTVISGLRMFHSFIKYEKNAFLKVFDLEGMEFISVVDADLKG